MKTLLKTALATVALAGAMLSPAQAVPLSTLLAGGSITAGDKLFDNWSVLNYTSSIAGRTFNAANIDVSALTDGGTDPGPGLMFQVSGGELSVAGDDVYAFIDLMFGFRASVLTAGQAIVGNQLQLSGATLSWLTGTASDSGGYIRETLGSLAGTDDLGLNEVEYSQLDGSLNQVTSDTSGFAAQSALWVTKNILVWGGLTTDFGAITEFSQRFAQSTVPEPASLALAALGLFGLVGARRRR